MWTRAKACFYCFLFYVSLFVLLKRLARNEVVQNVDKLPVSALKAILHQRGVAYPHGNIKEKSELADFVKSTGRVTEGDVTSATNKVDSSDEETFKLRNNFVTKVEHSKNEVWLVEVIVREREMLSREDWTAIRHKFGKFGIRYGQFYCEQDIHHQRFCNGEGWTQSQLLFVKPVSGDYIPGINSLTHRSTRAKSERSVVDWVDDTLQKSARTTFITTAETFNRWKAQSSVSVVMVATLKDEPRLLSTLSVSFPQSVKFGIIDASTSKGINLVRDLNLKPVQSFVVLSCDMVYEYGQRSTEILTHKAMHKFLKVLIPPADVQLSDALLFVYNVVFISSASITYAGRSGKFDFFIVLSFLLNIGLRLCIQVLMGFATLVYGDISGILMKVVRIIQWSPILSFLPHDIHFYIQHYWLVMLIAHGIVLEVCKWLSEFTQALSQIKIVLYRMIGFVCHPESINREIGTNEQVDEMGEDRPVLEIDPNGTLRLRMRVHEQGHDNIAQRIHTLYINLPTHLTANVGNNTVRNEYAGPTTSWSFESSEWPSTHVEWQSTDCRICLENYQVSEMLKGLPCGHAFHQNCVDMWTYSYGNNARCPLCRQ